MSISRRIVSKRARARKKNETMRLEGYTAIDFARANSLALSKYNDPIEDAREDVTPDEARDIAREDEPGRKENKMNAKSERKETYSVVVESGSHSVPARPVTCPTCNGDGCQACSGSGWQQQSLQYEERANCGHAHKTFEAAERCRAKLTRMYCNHGHVSGTPCTRCNGYAQHQTTSARWYGATIHNQDQERVDLSVN